MIVVVSNTSPLIALQQIGLLGLLETLFVRVLAPPAVMREARSLTRRPEWLLEHPLAQPLPAAIQEAGLGAGESEALALALELRAERVLLDELAEGSRAAWASPSSAAWACSSRRSARA